MSSWGLGLDVGLCGCRKSAATNKCWKYGTWRSRQATGETPHTFLTGGESGNAEDLAQLVDLRLKDKGCPGGIGGIRKGWGDDEAMH